ncbi:MULTISPECIES: 5-oxoprolinase subunit PxpB [unclassified Aureimonas]|uniref:5-oxoprolinase subunit PxpB n=1 Tax=unclassified Aureimonas TaxID=2615206 RepID=UPI0006FD4FC5|nr:MULTISPECIES: 5-oxoprolinase subunit PxpB [unclassified Aureimonas]KQT64376.1 allophanate hydrolase [Aureimonas sp. Leaf427]KQT81567.1 allophanate hydrolase [Aureimonas sp. Leaf460]
MPHQFPRILACGDSALSVELSDTIDEGVNARVIALAQDLVADPIAGVEDVVPTYRALLVLYDPATLRGADLGRHLSRRIGHLAPAPGSERHFEVPVVYGGAAGLDLDDLAETKGMTAEALIALHAESEYRVHMIGFAPGFAYLGGLPEPLHTPRLSVPRQRVEAGSIGIGGRQASINSFAGPSGWRFIGRTPLRLFDPARAQPCLLRAGDRVRFRSVGPDEGAVLEQAVARGEPIAGVPM